MGMADLNLFKKELDKIDKETNDIIHADCVAKYHELVKKYAELECEYEGLKISYNDLVHTLSEIPNYGKLIIAFEELLTIYTGNYAVKQKWQTKAGLPIDK